MFSENVLSPQQCSPCAFSSIFSILVSSQEDTVAAEATTGRYS